MIIKPQFPCCLVLTILVLAQEILLPGLLLPPSDLPLAGTFLIVRLEMILSPKLLTTDRADVPLSELGQLGFALLLVSEIFPVAEGGD